jgi:hypothetical protein
MLHVIFILFMQIIFVLCVVENNIDSIYKIIYCDSLTLLCNGLESTRTSIPRQRPPFEHGEHVVATASS